MSNQCKIEFYFKREELEKLLRSHPTAKGVIISQEIKRLKPKGADHYSNVALITARIDNNDPARPDGDSVDGCPYPPGCTD